MATVSIGTGAVLPLASFANVRPTEHDILIFDVKDGKPTVTKQDKGTDTYFKIGSLTVQPYHWYILPEGDKFKIMFTANTIAAAIAYFTAGYRTWLQGVTVAMHDTSALRLSTANTGRAVETFPRVLVARNRFATPNPMTYTFTYIPKYDETRPVYSRFWSIPPNSSYSLDYGDLTVTLLPSVDNPWYTNAFVSDIVKKVTGVMPAITTTAPPVYSTGLSAVDADKTKAATSSGFSFNWKILLFIFIVVAVVWGIMQYSGQSTPQGRITRFR